MHLALAFAQVVQARGPVFLTSITVNVLQLCDLSNEARQVRRLLGNIPQFCSTVDDMCSEHKKESTSCPLREIREFFFAGGQEDYT
jgi:hypothetical protein